MNTLNGYRLLVIAARTNASTVWHYSTGNDASVCERLAGANAVGYIDTEDAAALKGCCQACARYVAKHGDYQGYDSENEARWLSLTNPKPEAHCAMHNTGVSRCAAQHNNSDGGFQETNAPRVYFRENPKAMHYGVISPMCGRSSARRTSYKPNVTCVACLDNINMPAEDMWNAEDIPRGWENGSHRPNTDYDAAMSYPQTHYRGYSEGEARRAMADTLRHYATFGHIERNGRATEYLAAAERFESGERVVTLDGRHYRIRQGVHVNQTRGKGLAL